MNIKKHIVILSPGFAESEQDSTTIPALQIFIESLKKLNPHFIIQIIAFQYPYKSQAYHWKGLVVHPLNGRNSKLKKPFLWRKAWLKLKEINREKPIDILHSFWIGECSWIGEIFASKHNIKPLITAMGQDVLKPNYFVKLISPKKCSIITLSQRQHDFLKNNFSLESQIIPWGINEEEFPDLQEKNIDILGVGSINSVKNYNLFIDIISELKIEGLKIEIIGDGLLRNKLLTKLHETQLKNTITVTGELPRKNVLEKMAKAKILLHTSNYESFGLVFLEAMYSAMQIISFEVGIAKESSAWKVCCNKEEAILKLREALSNQNQQERILLYDIKNTVSKYCTIYNE